MYEDLKTALLGMVSIFAGIVPCMHRVMFPLQFMSVVFGCIIGAVTIYRMIKHTK